MRFHHSTRRRTRHSVSANAAPGSGGLASGAGSSAAAARWSLNYCRETNIHFNRRLPVEPPNEWTAPHETGAASIDADGLAALEFNINDNQDLNSWLSATAATEAPERNYVIDDEDGGRADEGMLLNLRVCDATTPDVDQREFPTNTEQQQCDILANENNYYQSNNQDISKNKKNNNNKSNNHNINVNVNTRRNMNAKQYKNCQFDEHQSTDMHSIREKLLSQVKKHPFWSNKAAKRMHLDFVERRRIYIYELVSFCERRQLEWRYEPYRGGLVQSVPYTVLQQDDNSAHQLQLTHNLTLATNNKNKSTKNNNNDKLRQAVTISPSHSGKKNVAIRQVQEPQSANYARSLPGSPSTSIDQHVQQQQQLSPASEQQQSRLTTPIMTSKLARNPMARSSSTTTSPYHYPNNQQQQQLDHEKLSRQNLSSPFRYTNNNNNSVTINASASNAIVDVVGLHNSSGNDSNNNDASQLQHQYSSSLEPLPLPVQPIGAIQRPLPSSEQIWSIPLKPDSLYPNPFKGYAHSSELPNSSFVKRCHGCQGKGRLKCKSCHGVGYEVCISCSGKGTTRNFHSKYSGGGATNASSNGYGADSSRGGGITGNGGGITWSSDACGDSASDSRASRNDSYWASGGGGQSSSSWVTESCHFCHGAGQKRCWVCAGKSYNHCPGCFGAGRLRCYLMLHIVFLNHRDESFLNNSDEIIPKDRLRLATGRMVLNELADQLSPLMADRLISALEQNNNEPNNNDINNANESSQIDSSQQVPSSFATAAAGTGFSGIGSLSMLDDICLLQSTCRKLMNKHKEIYRNERLIKQRQTITQIGTEIVSYEWKRRSGKFAIYGDERKVYIAKYPYKSICNIT